MTVENYEAENIEGLEYITNNAVIKNSVNNNNKVNSVEKKFQ